jgi:hypothetical protein
MTNLEDSPKRLGLSRVPKKDRTDYRRGRAVRHSCWQRLARFARVRVGRPWREVQVELDRLINKLPVAAGIRHELRTDIHRGPLGLGLVVDDDTGLLTLEPHRPRPRRPRPPVSYSLEELRVEPETIR